MEWRSPSSPISSSAAASISIWFPPKSPMDSSAWVAFLQGKESVYEIEWTPGVTYADVRLADELQFSVYNFELADVGTLWQLFDLYEKEGQRLLELYKKYEDKQRFPLLPTYDQVLKCSNIFNLLDARGAISVTERVGVIARVRKLAVGVAHAGWIRPHPRR